MSDSKRDAIVQMIASTESQTGPQPDIRAFLTVLDAIRDSDYSEAAAAFHESAPVLLNNDEGNEYTIGFDSLLEELLMLAAADVSKKLTAMASLLASARRIGNNAYDLEKGMHAAGPKQTADDSIHHPGDDTGRLMWDGYEQGGASAATEVLEAYLEAFNNRRVKDNLPILDPNDLAATLGWAFSVKASQDQIADVRAEFCRRQNIQNPSPKRPRQ